MPSSSKSEADLNGVGPGPSPAAIREQLKRLLAHPLFANSKRYPVLLAYTVEQTVLGHSSELKERTIGIEAFGRNPLYDVNLDPVVRTTAAEVRKRLVQYYYNHPGELLIELPVGSYVANFSEPYASQATSTRVAPPAETGQAAFEEMFAPLPYSEHARRYWILITTGLIFALLAGFGVGRIRFSRQPSSLQRFWQPITSGSGRVTYCLGEPVDAADREQIDLSQGMPLNGGLDVSDVITLARSIVPLVPRHDAFRVVSASGTEFAQLREGPDVLIGAFDNIWTMRITQDLPFGFESENHIREIVDRKSSQKRIWSLQWQVPYKKLARDYAIVARIHDNVTGQPVIILAGILGEGTEAASEVVSNPVYLNALLQNAPQDWEHFNLEAIIETNVIEGQPGPPRVVAVEIW
jgi:hypothetical protein